MFIFVVHLYHKHAEMMAGSAFTIAAQGLADTNLLASRLAALAEAGDVILLEGDLGAGKTQWVQFFCAALGYTAAVTSPSYAVVNSYPIPGLPVIHADFYRLRSEGEFFELGLDEDLERSVLLAEWGTKLAALFEAYLLIRIDRLDAEARRFELRAFGDPWEAKLHRLKQLYVL